MLTPPPLSRCCHWSLPALAADDTQHEDTSAAAAVTDAASAYGDADVAATCHAMIRKRHALDFAAEAPYAAAYAAPLRCRADAYDAAAT